MRRQLLNQQAAQQFQLELQHLLLQRYAYGMRIAPSYFVPRHPTSRAEQQVRRKS